MLFNVIPLKLIQSITIHRIYINSTRDNLSSVCYLIHVELWHYTHNTQKNWANYKSWVKWKTRIYSFVYLFIYSSAAKKVSKIILVNSFHEWRWEQQRYCLDNRGQTAELILWPSYFHSSITHEYLIISSAWKLTLFLMKSSFSEVIFLGHTHGIVELNQNQSRRHETIMSVKPFHILLPNNFF